MNLFVLISAGLLISTLVSFPTVNFIMKIGSLFIVLVKLNNINYHRISPSDHVQTRLHQQWMRRDLTVALYFFIFTIVALLLTPLYLLAVIRVEPVIIGDNCNSQQLMSAHFFILLIRIVNVTSIHFFSHLQFGTRLPTKLRTFPLLVMLYDTGSVTRTSWNSKNSTLFWTLLSQLSRMKKKMVIISYLL